MTLENDPRTSWPKFGIDWPANAPIASFTASFAG
jgi:hypothetical protein